MLSFLAICALLPAALAMAEHEYGSGDEPLRAVVLGYDLFCAVANRL